MDLNDNKNDVEAPVVPPPPAAAIPMNHRTSTDETKTTVKGNEEEDEMVTIQLQEAQWKPRNVRTQHTRM